MGYTGRAGGVHPDLRGVRRGLVRHLLPSSLRTPGPYLWHGRVLVCLWHVLVVLVYLCPPRLRLSLSLSLSLSISIDMCLPVF
jgi:hypothetical protein